MIPASILSRVLLPEPFWPMRPIASPGATSRSMSRTAQSSVKSVRRRRRTVSFSVRLRSWTMRKLRDTPLQADPARLDRHGRHRHNCTAISRSRRRNTRPHREHHDAPRPPSTPRRPRRAIRPKNSTSWIAMMNGAIGLAQCSRASPRGAPAEPGRRRSCRRPGSGRSRAARGREDVLDVPEVDVDGRQRQPEARGEHGEQDHEAGSATSGSRDPRSGARRAAAR